MIPGIQKWLSEAGKSACYSLAIIEEGHPGISLGEAMDLLMSACAQNIVHFTPSTADTNNFYVNDPEGLMRLVTGSRWKVRKEYNTKYSTKPGEKVIKYYEWDKGNGSIQGHFVSDGFDSWGDSQTVKNGKLKSLRVFSRV